VITVSERVSGYDPASGICWRYGNKGDSDLFWNCRCPVCSLPRDQRRNMIFGRARSGRRWLWIVVDYRNNLHEEGWVDSEDEAWVVARSTVLRLANGQPLTAGERHGWARERLKEINKDKRAAHWATTDTGSETAGADSFEYLYSHTGCNHSDGPCGCAEHYGLDRWFYHVRKFRIIKKTAQRIYYDSGPLPWEQDDRYPNIRDLTEYQIRFINRQKIEQDGQIWSHANSGWWEADCRLYLQPPMPEPRWLQDEERRKPKSGVELLVLKQAMADAHPDRGGSDAAFIAARERYLQARAQATKGAV
jgi:hypothetical protein